MITNHVNDEFTRRLNINRTSSDPHPAILAAWHLDWDHTTEREAFNRAHAEVSGLAARDEASTLEWLHAGNGLGMAHLLRRLEYFSSRFGVDSADAFNRISLAWFEKPLFLANGIHLNRWLWKVARYRALDCVRQKWRMVGLADVSPAGETENFLHSAQIFSSMSSPANQAALDQMKAILNVAVRPASRKLGDRIFARHIEMEGTITQAELAAEFRVNQATVSRHLIRKCEALKRARAADQEMDILPEEPNL